MRARPPSAWPRRRAQQRPDALVFARAIDAEHAVRLLRLGAIDVIPEAVEASLQLGGRLLEGLGVSDEAVVAAARRTARAGARAARWPRANKGLNAAR